MKVPDKIYVQIDKPTGAMFVNYDRNDKNNVEYIRKDALLEWLESKVYEHNEDRFDDGFNTALGQVIDKINLI